MKLAILTILLLALAAPVFAADSTATRQLGIDFGVLMSPNEKPTLASAVTKDWSLKGLGGPVFEKIELSAVYSNRETTTGSEVFAMRGYTTHDVCFGPASQQWYLGAMVCGQHRWRR
jgi:hypothetical protein